MKIKIMTLFPEMYDSFLNYSIIKRAISKNLVEIKLLNIRDYTLDKNKRVDSPPVGGGAGLIMKCQPVIDCLKANCTNKETKKIVLSPRGKTFNQDKAIELSKEKELIIFCGHYEGFDERIYKYFDECISIGDFILTGGESASIVMLDSIIRLIDGVISKESIKEESFYNNLIEYPQYTEPYSYNGDTVPDILYCGNHEAIKKYRLKKSLAYTNLYRKDIYKLHSFTKEELNLIDELKSKNTPKWEIDAIEKGKKFIKS